MEKLEKAVRKRVEEALKQLRKEGVAESDWKLFGVACTPLAAADDAPGVERVTCEVLVRDKKTKEDVIRVKVEMPSAEVVETVGRVIIDNLREFKLHGTIGGVDPREIRNENPDS